MFQYIRGSICKCKWQIYRYIVADVTLLFTHLRTSPVPVSGNFCVMKTGKLEKSWKLFIRFKNECIYKDKW